MKFIQTIKNWLVIPPNDSDSFGVNIRQTIQVFFKHKHEWEHRTDHGEEEHGINFYKRYCKHCNHQQVLMYNRFGVVRYTWEDLHKPSDIKLNK